VKASTSSLILLFCSLVATCGTGSNSSRTIVHNPPPERVAENERPVEYIIARFRFLLDELTTKFVENRKQIAEMTVKSHELFQKGVEEFLLNVMEGINKIMPTTIRNQQYAEYTACAPQIFDLTRKLAF
jgi:hypothetical protein